MKTKLKTNLSLAAVALMATFPSNLPAQPAQIRLLHGGVPAAVARYHLQPLHRLASTNELRLAICLPLRNEPALDDLLRQLYDPASPNYRHYLTPAQFTERFGPTREDYEKVVAFIESKGLTITHRHPDRMVLDVSGSAQNIEKAFHVKMEVYQHPKEARTFYAPDTEPSVALTVPISYVEGLNNYSFPRPLSVIKSWNKGQTVRPNDGSGLYGYYMGKDFRAAYVPDTTLTGAGQTVGLVTFDSYDLNDILYYEETNGLPDVPLTNVLINAVYNGTTNWETGVPFGVNGTLETSLDIEMVVSMAPGVSRIVVYEEPMYGTDTAVWADILDTIVNDTINYPNQISCSWQDSTPGLAANDFLFKDLAAQGRSFFAGSGDSDAYTGAIPFPSESTNVTVVGGTTLSTGPGASYLSETVWNWGYDSSVGGYEGSGGGVSTDYPIPDWQQGIDMTANQGSTTMRNTPDVALTADEIDVRALGTDWPMGGTSCATPLWAGFAALVNQQAQAIGNPPVGFLNPAIYTIGKGPNYHQDFHDITSGDNTWPNSPTKFYAVSGYDLCTGWGTPAGQNLINDLSGPADSLYVTPFTGFHAMGFVGGSFNTNTEIFTLTNTSASSLNWQAGNLPSWLTVSSASGTLPVGGKTTVTVNLSSSATSLPVGVYTASVSFTDLSDNVVLSRQFSLAIFGPPEPASPSAPPGGTATFSATVPAGPFTCQWQFNGVNLPNEVVATVAGGGTTGGQSYNGPAIDGQLSSPSDVAVDSEGNFYIADTGNQVIRKVDSNGNMTTVAGGGTETATFYSGPATDAYLGDPVSVTVDASGNLFIADYNYQGVSVVHKVDTSHNISTIAGGGANSIYNGPANGPATGYSLPSIGKLATDNEGNLYIATAAEGGGDFVLKVTPGGSMTTVAGGGTDTDPFYSGWATNALLIPGGGGLAVDGTGNLFLGNEISSVGGKIIRKVDNTGYMTPVIAFAGNGAVAVNSYGDLFFADNYPSFPLTVGPYPYVIDKMDTNGYVTKVAGDGTGDPSVNFSGPADRVGLQLWADGGLAMDGEGNLLIADTYNNVIRKVQLFASYPTLTLQNVTAANDGDYAVVITGRYGSVTSSPPATLYVGTPPVITSQPQPASQTVAQGANVTFSVGATGTDLTYQWRLNGNDIPGEMSSTLALANVQVADSGSYSVLVSNRISSVTSDNAILTVEAPPVITGQPTGLTYHVGDSTPLFFTVQATGTALQYEWYCNGVPCADQYYGSSGWTQSTSPTSAFIPNEYFAGINSVQVRVYNDVGQVWSTPVAVTVYYPPQILSGPGCVSVLTGGNASFNVSAAGKGLQYQWFYDGAPINGETGTNLNLTHVQPAQSGQYSVVVTDFGGTAEAAGTLAVGHSMVVSWGDNYYGEASVPCGLADVTAVAAGTAHSLALKPDGTVVGWGDNSYGEATPPAGLDNVVAIAAGTAHSLALKSDGTVVAWGINNYGQTNVPTGLANVVAIAAGASDSMALKSDGTVVEWGWNNLGQTNVPPGLTNVVAIATGNIFSMAVRANGTVAAWGATNFGLIDVPTALTNVVAIAAGYYHGLALKGDGTVVAWGLNNAGQTNVPEGLSNVVAISAGLFDSLALKADGTMVVWGNNGYGQTNVPSGLTNVVGIAGYNHILALVNDGAPAITLQPHNQNILEGTRALFNVWAVGNAPLYYQWRYNGANLIGGTNYSTLNIPSHLAGNFTVVVTNQWGSTTSAPPAVLSVYTTSERLNEAADQLNAAYSAWTALGASFTPDPGWDPHFQAALLSAVLCSSGTVHTEMVNGYSTYFVDPTQGAPSVGDGLVLQPLGQALCTVFGIPDGTTAVPGLNDGCMDGLYLATCYVNAFYKVGDYAYILSFDQNASPPFSFDEANPYTLPTSDYPGNMFSPCSGY